MARELAPARVNVPKARSVFTPRVMELRGQIERVHALWGDGGLGDLAQRLADPRGVAPLRLILATAEVEKLGPDPEQLPPDVLRASESARIVVVDRLARRIATDGRKSEILTALVNVNRVKDRYSAPFGDANAGGWIHTPSIVVSRAVGSLDRTTGGHNLDPEVTIFRPAAGVARGKVNLATEGGTASSRSTPRTSAGSATWCAQPAGRPTTPRSRPGWRPGCRSGRRGAPSRGRSSIPPGSATARPAACRPRRRPSAGWAGRPTSGR